MVPEIRKRLKQLANPERAEVSLRYFKTGPGQYGEGDQFIGNTVPDLRKLSREYCELSEPDVLLLLQSPIHEERVLALLISNLQFRKASNKERARIHQRYLKNMKWINNWDLVDCSSPILIGEYLMDRDPHLLFKLARSKNLWERRTAILATMPFIKAGRYDLTFQITELMLSDREDLIHKACGWMLREVGKRDQLVLEKFLSLHAAKMPRTMLRYAIEKFSEEKRKKFLKK